MVIIEHTDDTHSMRDYYMAFKELMDFAVEDLPGYQIEGLCDEIRREMDERYLHRR